MGNKLSDNTLKGAIERLQNTIESEIKENSGEDFLFATDDILYSYLANFPARICDKKCPLWDKCKIKDSYVGKKCPLEIMDSLDETKGFIENIEIDVVDPVTIRRILEYVALTALEKQMLEEISYDGVVIDVPMIGKDSVVTTTIAAHPLLGPLMTIIRERGKILDAYIMTPKSKADAKVAGKGSILDYIGKIMEGEVIDEDSGNKELLSGDEKKNEGEEDK